MSDCINGFSEEEITGLLTLAQQGDKDAVSKLVDGMTVEQIEAKLKGNTCGVRNTSCADQLCVAVRKALTEMKK